MNIKLFFIFILVVASNPLLATRKTMLKKHRVQDTLRREKNKGLTTKSSEFKARKKKLKLQKKSDLSRAYDLAYKGAFRLALCGIYASSCYWLAGEAVCDNNQWFKRTLAGFSAIATGNLAVFCGLHGIKSIYNNLFHWHERKATKMSINQKALNESEMKESRKRT